MSDALNVLRPHDANVVTGDVRKYLVELDVLLGMPIIEGCAIPQASPITAPIRLNQQLRRQIDAEWRSSV